MLDSLFGQSLFAALAGRGERAEILCVTNGCTDDTPRIAAEALQAQSQTHPFRQGFYARVANLPERGKLNAWNRFVHELSAREAAVLFLLDADIVLQHPETLWNMCQTLERHPEADIATDRPIKDLALKPRPTLAERLSLAASRQTQSADGQLTGQLYCIRAEVARNIWLPRGLPACEDGFIKSLVCTSFLTRPSSAERIVLAPDASHVFQAYVSWRDILKNQRRQMLGQTVVHLLVDQEIRGWPPEQKLNLAAALRAREAADPLWLERRIAGHLRRTRFFWRLFPGILTFRFRRLAKLRPRDRIKHFPMAVLGWLVMLAACRGARRLLRRGVADYWPDTQSPNLRQFQSIPSHRITPPRPAHAAGPSQGVES